MAKTKGGLDRWFAEKGVDIKTGKPCGRQKTEKSRKSKYPACRPSKRVSKDTPKPVGEMSAAEKKRFKKTKPSSKRIPYQHKRSNTATRKKSGKKQRLAIKK